LLQGSGPLGPWPYNGRLVLPALAAGQRAARARAV